MTAKPAPPYPVCDEEAEEVRQIIRDLPKWAVPVWIRMGIRLANGVPAAKAGALYWQEYAAAESANA